jgi:hypothetical protein
VTEASPTEIDLRTGFIQHAGSHAFDDLPYLGSNLFSLRALGRGEDQLVVLAAS